MMPRLRIRLPMLGLLLCLIATLHASAAQPAIQVFQTQLRSGQFPAALETARNAKAPREHDAMLAVLALAQQQAGGSAAAEESASEIYDAQTQQRVQQYLEHRARGGGAEPDFESLIELITATIAPETWVDFGGPGAIDAFAGGVYVDARGTLRPLMRIAPGAELTAVQLAAAAPPSELQAVRRPSHLRMVSLPRLQRELARLHAAGQPPTEAMQVLAGMQRIEYVFAYPERGDLVLAGPAGDWRRDAEQRLVSVDTGLPVVRLDDLIVIFRHLLASPDARFGCSITPTQQNLAQTRAFLVESSKRALRPGERDAWLERLRARLGEQTIDVFGLDPRTRAARVMVEADYRMKLVGMGLEPGVLGVRSYLESIEVPPGEAPPPLDVLRWWFTLNYDALLATPARTGFELRGQGVKVLSENELLTEQGQRVHTGEADALNQQFAHSFTTHFPSLCQKYPIYAELRNLFDLALVGALLRAEGLPEQVGWQPTLLCDAELYPIALGPAAERVETVINHRVINQVHIVAGVSGGVSVDPTSLVQREAIAIDPRGLVGGKQQSAAPRTLPAGGWWWD